MKFNEAANAAYDFVWGTFCDWYLELSKPVMTGEDEAVKAETRATAAFVLDAILKLLHPFMPFVSEELWAETGKIGPARDTLLVHADWPVLDGLTRPEADAEMEWLIALISGIRSVRAEMNVPAGAKIPLAIVSAGAEIRARMDTHQPAIERLARIEGISFVDAVPAKAAQLVIGEVIYALPLGDVIDLDAEKARLTKEVGKLDDDIAKVDKKLGNEQFVAKAPEEVIEEQRQRKEDTLNRRARLLEALSFLAG